MTYSLTPSLLSSWQYYLDAGEEWEESAESDFIRTLKREKMEPTPAMQDGINFENRVEALCEGKPVTFLEGEDYERCVREVADWVRGGTWQVNTSKIIAVDGVSFLFHGRMDILKGPWIYDLKFSKSFDIGKYRDSPQTIGYLACEPGPVGIRYLVCDGSRVFVDEYRREDVGSVDSLVAEFWQWVAALPRFGDLYRKFWAIVEE
jgi:hypothetical protein